MSRGQLPKSIRRGDVVWIDDPFDFEAAAQSGSKDDHPYVIISTDSHPFHGKEYLAMLITRTERSIAVPIPDEGWQHGSLSYNSYVNPWTVVTLKDGDLFGYSGTVTESVITEAVDQLPPYIGL